MGIFCVSKEGIEELGYLAALTRALARHASGQFLNERPDDASPAPRQQGATNGGQLHRVRTISHQQDHLDPAHLHRRQRTLPHRNSPPRRASHLHRTPPHLRTRLLATARTHRRRALPRRPATAHDRHRRRLSTQHRRTRPLRPGRPLRRHQEPRPARRPARTRRRLHRKTARTPTRHRVHPRRDPASTPHRTRPRPARLLPHPHRRDDDHAWAPPLHPTHHHLTRPVPPRPVRHPTHP